MPENLNTDKDLLQPDGGGQSDKVLYTLVINGKPEGPFTIAQLKENGIRYDSFVRTAAMDDYKEAHELPELRSLLGFKKQFVIPQYFAGFDQRLLASVIDWFLISSVFAVLALIGVIFTQDKMVRLGIAGVMILLIPIAKIIYHMVMECSAKQATVGKQLLKIKVCDMNGSRLTPAHSIGRNLAKILSVLTFFVGYLFSFFNKQQQCLHDMVAGTLMVKDRLI